MQSQTDLHNMAQYSMKTNIKFVLSTTVARMIKGQLHNEKNVSNDYMVKVQTLGSMEDV